MAVGSEERTGEDYRWLRLLLGMMLVGVAAIALYALQAETRPAGFAIASVAAVLSGAALLAGGLTGFLFGIPRRVQETEGAGSDGRLYGANTNLEQISDWLTKILVGVGLTQLGEIGTALNAIGEWGGKGLGGFPSAPAFAVGLVMYFAITGFLIAYLWTRLFLGRALSEAETQRRLDALERQTAADVAALGLAARQLGDDANRPSQAELDQGLARASSETRAHIFYRAQLVRWRNWREDATKPIMERTVPIFRALIAADSEDRYHANHGQLGFALKDQRKPDWVAAEAALSRAIAIRGDPGNSEWRSYEFNRALCRIMTDANFEAGRPSEADARRRIEDDLAVARQDEWVRGWMTNVPALQKWMALNGISLAP